VLPSNAITSVAIDKYENKWIGTNDAGLVIFKEGGVILNIQINIPLQQNDVLIYPNPFSHSATIEFKNEKKEKYTLTIYHPNGQLVRKIDNITNGTVKIEKENLKSGLYFYQLMNNSKRVGAGKIIVE